MKRGRLLAVAGGVAAAVAFTGIVSSNAADAHPAAQHYEATVMADQPYLYWRLGESSGKVAQDASGNEREGTYVGTSKLGVPGLIKGDPDTAVHFYGGSGVSWTPTGETVRSVFTAEAWARPAVSGPNLSIITSRTSTAQVSFDVKFSTAQGRGFRIDVGDGTVWMTTTTVPYNWLVHQTYLVDAVVGPHGASLYIDGRLLKRISFHCTQGNCLQPLLTDADHPIQVGYNLDDIERMRGTIDEVAIYDYTLTAKQVAAHYQAGR